MRYPNTRYGNPVEFQYYTQGQSTKDIAKRLRRSERSVNLWLTGKRRMPWWIPEILRLQRLEYDMWMRQAGLGRMRDKLGVVRADVIEFSDARPPIKSPKSENNHGDSQVD